MDYNYNQPNRTAIYEKLNEYGIYEILEDYLLEKKIPKSCNVKKKIKIKNELIN